MNREHSERSSAYPSATKTTANVHQDRATPCVCVNAGPPMAVGRLVLRVLGGRGSLGVGVAGLGVRVVFFLGGVRVVGFLGGVRVVVMGGRVRVVRLVVSDARHSGGRHVRGRGDS